jgi:hypothetical protein
VAVTLDSTFFFTIMASSKQECSNWVYLHPKVLCIAQPNYQVKHIAKEDPKNRRGYTFLLYCTSEELEYKGGKAIIEYQEPDKKQTWYQLLHNASLGQSYLGEPCPEVTQYNFEPHDEENFVVANKSEPETPFTPRDKGKQRANTDNKEVVPSPKSESTNKQLQEAK